MRALAILVVVACGGDAKPEAPPSAEAGKVVELTGKVTATREAATRTLSLGNGVRADDVITTAPESSIVIELAHNNARWSLESGITSRVDASVAWTLPKQDAAQAVEHATSSAGRHADRQAANTAITAEADVEEREKARDVVGAAQNDADREAAKAKLQALRKQKSEAAQRIDGAKAAAAKAERVKGVKISKECMDNPLARGCDGPSEDDQIKVARAEMRRWADELCACTDKTCAAKVDGNHGPWRSALDKQHPPTSAKGKEIAAAVADSAKRLAECRAKLP
jgi:hypothetical protein